MYQTYARITVLVSCFYSWMNNSTFFKVLVKEQTQRKYHELNCWHLTLKCLQNIQVEGLKRESGALEMEMSGKVWKNFKLAYPTLIPSSFLFGLPYYTGYTSNKSAVFYVCVVYRDGNVTKIWFMCHKLEFVKALSGKLCSLIHVLSHLCLILPLRIWI